MWPAVVPLLLAPAVVPAVGWAFKLTLTLALAVALEAEGAVAAAADADEATPPDSKVEEGGLPEAGGEVLAAAAAAAAAGAPMDPKAWAACQRAEDALRRCWWCGRHCCCGCCCVSGSMLCCEAVRRWPRKCIMFSWVGFPLYGSNTVRAWGGWDAGRTGIKNKKPTTQK